jgi:hypothetical protein
MCAHAVYCVNNTQFAFYKLPMQRVGYSSSLIDQLVALLKGKETEKK